MAKLPENAGDVLDAAIGVLEGLADFSPEAQQAALSAVLVEQMGIKPRFAFGALRVGNHGPPRVAAALRVDGHLGSVPLH